jgi:stalled ribosome alternative rescue factor ArfA
MTASTTGMMTKIRINPAMTLRVPNLFRTLAERKKPANGSIKHVKDHPKGGTP